MIQTVTEHDFVSAFLDWDNWMSKCFSYEGLKSLFEHFEDVIEDTGEQIELDVVAICGDYEEFENLDGFHARYGKAIFSHNGDVTDDGTWVGNVLKPLDITHIRTIDELQQVTTVIPVPNADRIIVRCF